MGVSCSEPEYVYHLLVGGPKSVSRLGSAVIDKSCFVNGRSKNGVVLLHNVSLCNVMD